MTLTRQAEAKASELQARNTDLIRDTQQAQADLDDAQSALEATVAAKQESAKEAASARKALAKAQQEADAALADLKKMVNDRDEVITDLKEEAQASHTLVTQLRADVEAARKDCASKVATARQRAAEAETGMMEEHLKLVELQGDKDDADDRASRLEASLKAAESQAKSSRAEAGRTIESALVREAEYRTEAANARAESTEAQIGLAEAESRAEAAQTRLEKLEARLTVAEEQNSGLQRQMREIEEAGDAAVACAQSSLARVEEESKDLRKEAASLRHRNSDLDDVCTRLETKLKERDAVIDADQATITELRRSTALKTDEVSDAANSLKAAGAALDEQEKTAASLQNKLGHTEQRLQQFTEEGDGLKSRVESLELQLNTANAALTKAEAVGGGGVLSFFTSVSICRKMSEKYLYNNWQI